MVPTPQEQIPKGDIIPPSTDGERVVISGMSGLYPQSHHVKDLERILYSKENPVTDECRWNYNHPEVRNHTGKIPGLDRFDAQFFMVSSRLATCMDVMCKKILEQAYQAIYDAGVCPEALCGKKIGVYTGTSFSEFDKVGVYDTSSRTGLGILGCCKAMSANRISYWLNVTGPSMSFDDVCCSSTTALEQAFQGISRGECEAALVGGANACLHPQSSVHYGRIVPLCKDGNTKSFDQNADGLAKSEGVSVIFLQKAKDAKRIYAEVLHVKSEFMGVVEADIGAKYGFYRNPTVMATFLKNFYKDAKVPPEAVEYVEAFGSAVPDADKAELEAIEEVFCKNRSNPLLVGSVMSNIGNGEAASGLSAITKVLLGYHNGKLAANLHCENPRRDVAALRDGRMEIVTDHKPFHRTYTAVNGMSVTGITTHVLLHGHYKPKDPERYKSTIPRLVTISARQDTAVEKILNILKSKPIDPEELALLHNVHQSRISGHVGRGYTILDVNDEGETVSLSETASYFDDATRPLWFVYSGMGSQWAGMGTQLMRIPVFAAAIERCRKVLEPLGVDVMHIITSPDKTIFNNILNSFVGIAAIQIGLTDIMTSLGIVPDYIIGHSVGELGCAYADGCFTAEEMILSAYSRGLVSVQTPFIKGSMAAVGMGYQKIIDLLPPEIEVACHNGPDSCTISGPADVMKGFVAKLTKQSIFAKEVPCSNIAYHSRYIAKAGPGLLKYLSQVIKDPKPRSARWVSTSVPADKWDEPEAKFSSAYYHTNNLLSSVLFEETSRLIPANAVLVEIAPHGLLQAILKRSLPESCKHIPLTRRGHSDNAFVVLNAIGKLYMEGYNPKVQALYPPVEFPVSTGTPFLSSIVEWAHNEKWQLPLFVGTNYKMASACQLVISPHDKEHAYLQGHVLRGKLLYPFSGALVAVWDTLAMSVSKQRKQLSVQFQDVHLYAQPPLHDSRPLRLSVALHRANGRFEIMDLDNTIMTGYIYGKLYDVKKEFVQDDKLDKEMDLTSEDIYQMFFYRDYFYRADFRSIQRANATFTNALIKWNNNWVTYLDGILQLSALKQKHNTISQVFQINKISIDLQEHSAIVETLDGKNVIEAKVLPIQNMIRCGGVVMENVQLQNLPMVDEVPAILKPWRSITNIDGIMDGDSSTCQDVVTLTSDRRVSLRISRIGDLESLHWVEVGETTEPGIPVNVQYAAINDLDVKKATGVVPSKSDKELSFCMDFSGVTDSGKRVMGMVASGAASGRVKALPELLWPVPEHWSLEDAATVPSAYAHAFYCLDMKVQFCRGYRVLVLGAAGALGQAVISIALAHGCEVFAAVSDVHKKRFLMRLFPEIKEDHISNSRNSSFRDMVITITKGKGCNVVISCTKGELKNVCLNSLDANGIMLDTVQLQNQENYSFGMFHLTKMRNYMPVDLCSLFHNNLVDDMERLQVLMSEGIARGYVRPLSRVTYAPLETPRAFSLVAASRHRGRVLISLHDKLSVTETRLTCSPDRCHVILSDDQTFSIQLAERLIDRGARKLHLNCVNPSNFMKFKVKSWKNAGVKVQVSSEDINNKKSVIGLLNEGSRLGLVEGIYVIATDANEKNVDKLKVVVANLDLAARKLCPSIRYFAVISTGIMVGQNTCTSRALDHLPGTALNLSDLRKPGDIDPTQSALSWRSAVDATERALRSSHLCLLALPQPAAPHTLLQQIAQVADIKVSEDVPETATLLDLGLDLAKVPAVCTFLRHTHNFALSEDSIPNLTVQKLQELENAILGSESDVSQGLQIFFSFVDPDELLATTNMVFVPTQTKSTSNVTNEFDVKETYLCVVPGMEGHHRRFQVLCERLKLPALVLQPDLDHLQESLKDTAERYAKMMLDQASIRNDFYLLGYESGVMLALEMAAIIEQHGLTGTVFCVGSTPEEFQVFLEENLKQFPTDEALQDAIVCHMYGLMTYNDDVKEINEALQSVSTWKEKVEVCVRMLLGRVAHSAQYARSLIEAAYVRIKQARSYKVQARDLRSKVVLLHAASLSTELSPAASLQRYSQQPVAVHELRETFANATQDLRCSAIINNYLDPKILKAFEEKNLCESYLVASDFIAMG